jgi:cysteinyl-tRNA synthetase
MEARAIEKKEIGLYVCGRAACGRARIEDARVYVFFDVVRRFFEYKKYRMNCVIGIDYADADKRMPEESDPAGFIRDMDALGVKRAAKYPDVAENIDEIVKAVGSLIDNGYAYVTGNRVYFDSSRLNMLGDLLHQDVSGVPAAAQDMGGGRAALDFPIWLGSDSDALGWDSQWGRGVPSGDIQYAVLAGKYLGEVDISGGGRDMIYPHNERARMEYYALHGKELSKAYVYVGLVTNGMNKASRSGRKFVTIGDMLSNYSSDEIRYFFLSHAYKEDLECNEIGLGESMKRLDRARKKLSESGVEKPNAFLSLLEDDMRIDESLRFLEEHGNRNMRFTAQRVLGIEF